ncbi:MAG: type II toxin-antitoxin system RelE/ParE family toxin [Atopobiaceae bacterium]|nr:type II toxin-antitoxin system RelE/ParE family toxin [Atopobiaceae bacterium]MBR3314692.1 type II toxin-antitoxin system RelE/ParE family toxin [Atopobiaceae bacterium]
MREAYEIVYSPESVQDLRDISRYITSTLHSPQSARRTVAKVRDAIRSLAHMPKRHQLVSITSLATIGIRRIIVGNYLVLYLVDDDAKSVTVSRIIHGGRNLEGVVL